MTDKSPYKGELRWVADKDLPEDIRYKKDFMILEQFGGHTYSQVPIIVVEN